MSGAGAMEIFSVALTKSSLGWRIVCNNWNTGAIVRKLNMPKSISRLDAKDRKGPRSGVEAEHIQL